MLKLFAFLFFFQFYQALANNCEERGFRFDPTQRLLPIPQRDAKLDRRDFSGVLEDAIKDQSSYAPLAWPEHEAKLHFLIQTFLPYAGWRGILARPGDFRPVTVSGNRLVLHAYGGSSALTFVWEPGIQEPHWSVAGETGFHSFTLRIPIGFTFKNLPNVEKFFDTGLIGHDLQRYTATLEIQRIRQVLGEDRFVPKPGQRSILEKFSQALDSEDRNGITRFLVLGPSAYGKTFLLISAMKERMRRRNLTGDPSYPRNLFVVVTRKRNIAAQISDEIFYNEVLSQSQSTDFEHWGLHDEKERQQKVSPKDLIRRAQQAREQKKSLIVTIDWSHLSTIVKAAAEDAQSLTDLRTILNGLYIDEADQTHLDHHLQTITAMTEDQSGVIIWGQDAMSFHHEVRDVVFRGHVYRIFEDELDPTITDAATLTVQQTRIATHRGEIAPIVDFRDNHVITHYLPGEILERLISSGRDVPYNALFQPITDEALRRDVYEELAQKAAPFLKRHKGYIRVNTTEQADQLAEFLQSFSDDHQLGLNFAAFHSKTRQSEQIYSRWRNYYTSEQPIDWLISVRLLDESIDAAHISGVLLLTDDIDEETFLKIYGRPTRLFPGKRFSEIWQISHHPIVDQKIIEGLQRKEQELNALEETKTSQGMRIGHSTRLEQVDLTTQHLLPLFPTDVRDLEHLGEKIKELNQALTILSFLLSEEVASDLLRPFADATPHQQRSAISNLSLKRHHLLNWASRTIARHLGSHLFTNDKNVRLIDITASLDPTLDQKIAIFRDVSRFTNNGVEDFVDIYLSAVRENNRTVKNQLIAKTSLDLNTLLYKTKNDLPANFLESYFNEEDLVKVVLQSYEASSELNPSTLKLISHSVELRKRLKSLWPITKTEAFTRMRRLKMAGLWDEAISIDRCEEQLMDALLDFVIAFYEIKARLVRINLAQKYGKPGQERLEKESQIVHASQKKLLETAAILIPADPILNDMVRSFQRDCPASIDSVDIQNFHCSAAVQAVVHLESVYDNLFPKGVAMSGALVVLKLFSQAAFSPLTAIDALMGTRETIVQAEKNWITNPQLRTLRSFAGEMHTHVKENPALFVGMVIPDRDDPLFFRKILRFLNDRISFLQDAVNLHGEIKLSRDDFAIYSRQPIQKVFLGHEGSDLEADIAKAMISQGHRTMTIIGLSGSLIYDPSTVTENRHNIRQLFFRLSQSYEEWMNPATPPLDNLWNLELKNRNHEEQQQLILSSFDEHYRGWLHEPHRMHLGHIFSDEKKIAVRNEEILYWLYAYTWRATQFVLVQKSLDPQHRLVPIEVFSDFQQALVKNAVETVNEYLRTEEKSILTSFVADVRDHVAHERIEQKFRISKPLEELNDSSLQTLRNEIKRNITALQETQKTYGALPYPAIWEAYQASALHAYGLDQWVTPTNTARVRDYYTKHLEKLTRVLYQVDQQLYESNPKVYPKPKKR